MTSKVSGESSDYSKKRRSRKQPVKRVLITIPPGLLELVDEAAEKDFTSRSDIVRTALLWYLRPQGRDLSQTDPEVIYKVLQHRRTRAAVRKLANNSKFTDD